MAPRTEEQVLAELTEVGSAIAAHEGELEQLYPRRLALFQEAKDKHGTINRRLAEAAGSTESAVIAVLRKAAAKAKGST